MYIEQRAQLAQHGVALLKELYDAKLSVDQISALFRIAPTQAAQYRSTAKALFGQLADAGQKDIRREALSEAQKQTISAEELVFINQQTNKIAADIAYSKEKLRYELIQIAKDKDFATMMTAAKAHVRAINLASTKKPRSKLMVSKELDARGGYQVMGWLDGEVFAPFVDKLESLTTKLYHRESGLKIEHCRAQALLKMVDISDKVGVHVVVKLSELQEGLTRDEYALTDGSIATLDLLHKKLVGVGFAVVYNDLTMLPMEAAVIQQRFANSKQRQAMIGHNIFCAAPGCKIPAKHGCQAHHIKTAASGGMTNLSNMVMLCPAHHGQVTAGQAIVTIDAEGRYIWECQYSKRRQINSKKAIDLAGRSLFFSSDDGFC
ncbi:Endonuclease [Corynebacterium kutscheri]|uniref:Endonuclease n=1 Tax=Corynebacterium kutscheri TaxID=35755 RepID=A0AB38VPN3_9CORY|nr:HNH endonuclease signature motif containing protein [Corynebacterium kutscheri]VEH04616.1 Endonuclease [Corynebacterium kutscheri]VEH80395.1 Endonuclease [Corynebacterium kutscheri]